MMAKEHECDSRGRPSFVPLDDAELDEDNDDEDVDEDGEIPMVQSGFHGVSSSGDIICDDEENPLIHDFPNDLSKNMQKLRTIWTAQLLEGSFGRDYAQLRSFDFIKSQS